jgi:hypothetical protein
MPAPPRLGPTELAELVRASAQVLEDHASAIDLLATGPDGAPSPDAASSLHSEPDPGPVDRSFDTAGPVDLDRGAPTPGDGGRSPGVGTELSVSLAELASRLDGVKDLAAAAGVLEATDTVGGHPGLDAVLRQLGSALRNADTVDGERVAIGLELAAEALAPADDGAHPGGFAAVVAATAAGALGSLDRGGTLLEVLVAAADDGLEELERGPVLDPELAERGAVDAAAAGYLLFVDTAAAWVAGDPLPTPPAEPAGWTSNGVDAGVRYRVSCTVEPLGEDHLEASDWLESVWHELGDLERFDRRSGGWTVDLSTSLPGPAIEALCEVGRPRELRVELAGTRSSGDDAGS